MPSISLSSDYIRTFYRIDIEDFDGNIVDSLTGDALYGSGGVELNQQLNIAGLSDKSFYMIKIYMQNEFQVDYICDGTAGSNADITYESIFNEDVTILATAI